MKKKKRKTGNLKKTGRGRECKKQERGRLSILPLLLKKKKMEVTPLERTEEEERERREGGGERAQEKKKKNIIEEKEQEEEGAEEEKEEAREAQMRGAVAVPGVWMRAEGVRYEWKKESKGRRRRGRKKTRLFLQPARETLPISKLPTEQHLL